MTSGVAPIRRNRQTDQRLRDIAAGFVIADRIEMSVELVPHLFGEYRRPIGQRGLAYWRVGSKVVNKAALRTQRVK